MESRSVHMTTPYGWSVRGQADECHKPETYTRIRRGRERAGDRKNMVSRLQYQICLPLGLSHLSHSSLEVNILFLCPPPYTHRERKLILSYEKRIL